MVAIIFEESHQFDPSEGCYIVDIDKLPADDPYREVLADFLANPDSFESPIVCPWSASLWVRENEEDLEGKNLAFPEEAVVCLPQMITRLIYVYVEEDES